jgi:hypothetical protein
MLGSANAGSNIKRRPAGGNKRVTRATGRKTAGAAKWKNRGLADTGVPAAQNAIRIHNSLACRLQQQSRRLANTHSGQGESVDDQHGNKRITTLCQ